MTNIEEEIRKILEPEMEAAQGTPNYNWEKDGRNQRELYIQGTSEDIAAYIRNKLEELGEEIKSEADKRRGGYGNMDTVPGLYQGVDAAVERMTKGKH